MPVPTENDCASSEAARLREALQELRQASRPSLDGPGTLAFDPTLVRELRGVLEECQGLQRDAERGIERQSLQVEVNSLAGNTVSVGVNPEIDSVATLKARVAEQMGLRPFELKLFPNGIPEAQAEALRVYEAAQAALREARKKFVEAQRVFDEAAKNVSLDMQMANADMLSKYDLAAGITMVVADTAIENELLRLTFDNPEDLAFESMSSKSGTWISPNHKVAVDVLGRRGIDFQGHCVLRVAEPIELQEAWTISVWTLAPIDTDKPYRNLLDDTGDNRIVVTITGRKIGDYNKGAFVDYDPGTLPAGWHHIAAVGAEGSVSYYVDGALVGRHTGQTQGRISTVGNRGDGQCPESWGVMSDLRIFGSAASAEQVEALFQSS